MKKSLKLTALFIFFNLFLGSLSYKALAAVEDGFLVSAAGKEEVYLIDNGQKRWIESVDVFKAQGFDWNSITTINDTELESIPSGENVQLYSNIILPGEDDNLPDITPFAVDDFLFTDIDGRRALKFESTFWNQGGGVLEVRSGDPINPESPDTNNVYQRIYREDGTYRDKLVNDFIWHPAHNHYHYDSFITYTLESVDETLGVSGSKKNKVSFCFWDSYAIDLSLPSAPGSRVYTSCDDISRHGLSVGWSDVYPRSLPEQYIDVNDISAGTYKLTLKTNNEDRILEQDYNNNTSIAILYIDPSTYTVRQIASGAPFATAPFEFNDGLFIKGDASSELFITFNNKKRQLRGSEIIGLYGLSSSDAIEIPQGVVDAMQFNNLVRSDGIKVYALNDDGYKRHIPNPEIFESYGLSWQDIADIDPGELASYSDARFVRVAGTSQLYYQYSYAIWPLSSTAATEDTFPWEQLHIINTEDYANYVIGPELYSIPQTPPPLPEKNFINDTDIPLTMLNGYRISYFTHMEVGPVRFMAVAPDGVLFATRPSSSGLYSGSSSGGAVLALPDRNSDGIADEAISVAGTFTDYPHGISFYNNYLYIAEQSRVTRYPYIGDGKVGSREVVVEGLPSDGGHLSRTIVFSPSGKMYVSIGSKCNSCKEADNRRATIMEFNPDGSGGRIFAEGLRNSVGLDFHPETKELWASENGRDRLGDNLPPDEINIVKDGLHYGWPYCYGNKNTDPAFNDSSFCNTTEGSVYDIQAHSAILGMRFIDSSKFSQWEGDIVAAYHGSWNRTDPTGYKVVRFDVEGNNIANEENFIYGWLQGSEKLGRPVDVIFGADGALYISDDYANTIYRVEKL